MKKITLLCTTHEETGLANSKELKNILTYLEPEVIFFEAPAEAVNDYILTGVRQNLESTAIRQYLKEHAAQVVPVDCSTPDQSFFRKQKVFSERIASKCTDYRRLMQWNKNYISDHGFPYLNSDHSDRMWMDIYRYVRETVELIDEPEVHNFLQEWSSTNESREKEMISNVFDHVLTSSFENSVFLVGAAHRRSLINKAEKELRKIDQNIYWRSIYHEPVL